MITTTLAIRVFTQGVCTDTLAKAKLMTVNSGCGSMTPLMVILTSVVDKSYDNKVKSSSTSLSVRRIDAGCEHTELMTCNDVITDTSQCDVITILGF